MRFFLYIAVIVLHRLVSLFFPFSFSPSCSFWCVSPYLLELGGEKGQAVSFLLFKVQQAGYYWELPLFYCTFLFSFHLLLSTFSQERAETSADVVKRPLHTHSFDTPPCPCTFMSRVQSGAHQGNLFSTYASLPCPYPWFLFWTKLGMGACICLSVDQIKSFQWSPPGSWLCVRSADSRRARETSGDAPVTPGYPLWWVTSNDVHIWTSSSKEKLGEVCVCVWKIHKEKKSS